MFHHNFPNGRIEMDSLALDLSAMDAKDALRALDVIDDQAFDIWKDFCAQVSEARLRIQNTGSIHGNAVTYPVDRSGADRYCTECAGLGYIAIWHADSERHVASTCPACGGCKTDGFVIATARI